MGYFTFEPNNHQGDPRIIMFEPFGSGTQQRIRNVTLCVTSDIDVGEVEYWSI